MLCTEAFTHWLALNSPAWTLSLESWAPFSKGCFSSTLLTHLTSQCSRHRHSALWWLFTYFSVAVFSPHTPQFGFTVIVLLPGCFSGLPAWLFKCHTQPWLCHVTSLSVTEAQCTLIRPNAGAKAVWMAHSSLSLCPSGILRHLRSLLKRSLL